MSSNPWLSEQAPPPSAPESARTAGLWRASLERLLRRDPDRRWGTQLVRIASDIVVVCDESLHLQHHNRAFLKAVGHSSGTYRGRNLGEFFPVGEREGVFEAFENWRRGHAAGMRFQATLLSTRGGRLCDFRAVRSRDRRGLYHYYLVARDTAENRRADRHEDQDRDPFFQGLPVAAWRTDAHLRITNAFGSLWPELGAASEDLIGEIFGHRHDNLLPPVLRSVDCDDILAGMSLLTQVEHQGESFTVSVEPIIDAAGLLVGSIGILRRSAKGTTASGGSSLRGERHHTPPSGLPTAPLVTTGRVRTQVQPV